MFRKEFGPIAFITLILTLIGVIFAALQLAEAIRSSSARDTRLAYQVSLMEQQLSVSLEQATNQAMVANSPATATVVAGRAVELQQTAVALSTAQAMLQSYSYPPLASPLPQWLEQAALVPDTGSQIVRQLASGEFLYLSGGRIKTNSFYCGDDAQQICVLVFEATYPQSLTITKLIPKNNYLARSIGYDYNELVRIHKPFFWKWPNCDNQNGCLKATIFYLRDGDLIEGPTTVRRP